ncbi:MAG: tRNA pseudouridine(55) synthase TruB [Bacteroidetes bacterium 4572_117]|nr:MAG: tRNA pseudouridine(55) synthase TruB [Bacteroidetes bacterium 4572_117]
MTNFPDHDFHFIEGEVLLFDKPLNWTSFDLVRKVRFIIRHFLGVKKIKVGHAGTLDPKATGLLIVCTGRKTKEIEKFQAGDKEYIADIYLGATTPSFDRETEVDEKFPTGHITTDVINETLKTFIGKQEQIPPIFSAKRINGQRAYKNARKGIDVEMKPSLIDIKEIELINFNLPELTIRVKCGKGTYIRALARDIGQKMNSGGYLIGLRRTTTGEFNVDNAMSVDSFKAIIDSKGIDNNIV